LYHGQFELGVSEFEKGTSWRIGKQYFRVHAIAIQSLQALQWIKRGPRNFFPPLRIGGERITHKSGAVTDGVPGRFAVDAPTIDWIAVMSHFNDLGDKIPPFRGRHA